MSKLCSQFFLLKSLTYFLFSFWANSKLRYWNTLVQAQICLVPLNVVGINELGMFLLLSWTCLFILILGRFKVEVYSGANFQIVEPIASVKKCKCQWKDDAWDFVNLGHRIQCLAEREEGAMMMMILHDCAALPITLLEIHNPYDQSPLQESKMLMTSKE